MEHLQIHGPDGKSKGGAACAILLYLLGRINPSISDLAGIAAIFAGTVTGLYTLWKWRNEWLRKKHYHYKK